ncbi:hypothetical protein [Massilia sp. S19_KUP03_FR1]|uniref:hypothetical protein n=1 Tax=Massilia sp. S19_KUP03_FR1 TaxID=3025503 RepID=UPI002FCD7E65
MAHPGPALALLTHRLADTPAEFLAAPRIGQDGELAVAALVNDVLLLHGQRADIRPLQAFQAEAGTLARNRLQLASLCAWLLADPWFIDARVAQVDLLRALTEAPARLAPVTTAAQSIADVERREECVRVVLAQLGILPAGESAEQAQDRLAAISGAERLALLAASRAAERRARKIRAALAAKAAQESADKWTRE